MPTDFRSEFRPIVSQQSAFAFFICLTLAQRKHFQMRGIRPLAFWLCLEFLFGWFLFGLLGLLVFFSPSSCCVSFPFNDDLHTPHGVRTRGKKGRRQLTRLYLTTLAGTVIQPQVPVSIYHTWEMLEEYLVEHLPCISSLTIRREWQYRPP